MEKSRLVSQMDLLEKLVSGRSFYKSNDEEIIQYRNATTKILNLLDGCENSYRDVITRNLCHVEALINVLQANMDSQVTFNAVKIINDIVGKSNCQKRAQVFVHHGATKALLQCIYLESKENLPCEDYLLLLHQVLYKIGVKDKKIGVRARLSQCLPVIISLLRSQVNTIPNNRNTGGNVVIPPTLIKNFLTLLNVIRLYSQNLINASRLGRNGLIGLLLKIICLSGKSNLNLLKVTLETMNCCVRTKSNGARAVNQGVMYMLLQLFIDWNRIDSRDKQLPLRKSILSVVKNLISLRAGRKAFLEADGLHTFYGFCVTNKFHNNVESIVTLASLILRKCFPKNRLPLSHYNSVMRCPLPNQLIKEKSTLLLELRRDIVSPSAPRSTSPLDMLPMISLLGCHGDNDILSSHRKCSNPDKSFETMNYQQNFNQNQYFDVVKENNRVRTQKLFRSLDRKLSSSNLKNVGQIRHQNYLGQYSNSLNSMQPILPTNASNLLTFEDDQELFDDIEKEEKEEDNIVEQMFTKGACYQPLDDRPLDKLKESYEKFLFERELLKNEFRRKSSSENRDDLTDKNNYRFLGDNKRTKETLQPSLVAIQLRPIISERKPSRNTVPKSDLFLPRKNDASDEESQNITCTGIGIQRSGLSISQVHGLSQKSKRSSTQSKSDVINITNSINDLTESYEKISATPKENSPENSYVPHTKEEFMETYIKISSLVTKSLGRFNMIGYPDLWEKSFTMKSAEPLTDTFIQNQTNPTSDNSLKSLANNKRSRTNSLPQSKKPGNKATTKTNGSQRPQSASSNVDSLAQNKILDDLRRVIDSDDIMEKVVYDLDDLVNENNGTYNVDYSVHSNCDEIELDKGSHHTYPNLKFDSQFECGNLRKVIQIRQYEYDLILSPDVNTNHHTQWFYFRVSSMESGVPYRFNIINCEKPNSQFNFGMQPLMFSVKDSLRGSGFWRRCGSEIFYYKNHFGRSADTCGGNIGKSYFTCTFIIEFQYCNDVCYMAYHYPYTYTRLLTDVYLWSRQVKSSVKTEKTDGEGDSNNKEYVHVIDFQTTPSDGILFSVQEFCKTILKNPVPLITITNWPRDNEDYKVKQYVFLSSRVHPGESNSSWVMKGCIDFLISDNPNAIKLRDTFIFKIVPMLNPDGVINGCHRCSMSGQDLNRRWHDPCPNLNPTIYNTKGLMMLLTKLGQPPVVYCDMHGHSRRKNVFMFGCSPLMSWITDDTNNPAYIDQKIEDQSYYTLPNVLNKLAPQFSLDCCSFTVEKIKETTGRVVVWRQFGVKRSYTMESTYCSCDQGIFKNLHINVPMLQDMGERFAESLLQMEDSVSAPMFKNVPQFTTGLSSLTKDTKLTFKSDSSHLYDTKESYTHINETNQSDNESNVDFCENEFIENEDDDENVGSENEDCDKELDYNEEYDAEDSDE